MTESSGEVTQLLISWSNGNNTALDQLAPLVEAELRRLARVYLARESGAQTMQPTALINEAYLRLIDWKSADWRSRAHFFAVAAKMMRRILVNYAIGHNREKRGSGALIVPLDEVQRAVPERSADILLLDEALMALAKFDARKSEIVELRFFSGLSEEETAEVLSLSLRTIQREWSLARAWLFRQLSG